MNTTTINDPSLPDRLAARLRRRPARGGSSRFSPRLTYGRHHGPPPFDARPAAVTFLLYPADGRWHIPLTLRPQHLHDHAGQISLPGGRLEEDETFVEAACRELFEEVGVPASQLELLGNLSPTYVYVSDFRVDPIVACVRRKPRFRRDPREVEEIIELPLEDLLDATNFGEHEIRRGEIRYAVPHIACGPHKIWGATCLMIGEFIGILQELDDV